MLSKKALVCLVAVFGSAMAIPGEFPGPLGSDPWDHRPNDPSYDEMWQLFSHIPVDQTQPVSPWDAEHGSGMHVDRAWQLHRGDPSTVVAILDSGIRWHDADLLEQHYLNRDELPLPFGSDNYDANKDGRFSVSDYKHDPRVSDRNSNGKIDPEDLILAFSDGTDSDNNGYIDDISGWDFHEMDNNPSDSTDFGHGTGEARDSVAGLDNGIRGSGICGGCQFVSVRLNDSFIVDAQTFAAGVSFAHKTGVDLIQQALGAINHTEQVRSAVNAAFDDGIIIIGSAADEHSYHHNYPSTIDPIVYTNAIRYDSMDFRDATTFVNFNNCSNFGARVDVATSGRSCSSEATGNLSGISALAISYARSLNKPLPPGNLISLIKTSADDIDIGPAAPSSDRFSSYDGWDTMSGYGRTNAFNMLQAIRNDKIPAEARLRAPHWFELIPKNQQSVEIIYDARSVGQASLDVSIEVAKGVEIEDEHFVEIFRRTHVLPAEKESIKFHRDIFSDLVSADRDLAHNEHAYTFRLKVREAGKPTAEARRTVFVMPDQGATIMKLRASGEPGGLFADLNHDGRDEWVTVDGEGRVDVQSFSLEQKTGFPGFPVQVSPSRHGQGGAGVFASPAAGDLDGDGSTEIVVLTLDGHIEVFKSDGQALPGFPVLVPRPDATEINKDQIIAAGFMAAPVLADMDGDQKADVIAVGQDGRVYAYNHLGRSLPGFPIDVTVGGVRARLLSSPAVADINADGWPDLIFGSNHTAGNAGNVFAIDGQQRALMSGSFPTRIPLIRDDLLPTVGTGIPTSPVVGDFDGNGTLEIFLHGFAGKAYLIDHQGRLTKSFTLNVGDGHGTNDERMIPAFGHPSLARWDNKLMPVTTGVGMRMLVTLLLGGKKYVFQHMVTAWDFDSATMQPNFPQQIDDMTLGMQIIAADLDADGNDELLASSGGYYLRGYNKFGRATTWDRFTGGWALSSPALGDFDGDGRWDIGITTREGYSFIFKTEAVRSAEATWPTFKGNNQRTGHAEKGNTALNPAHRNDNHDQIKERT